MSEGGTLKTVEFGTTGFCPAFQGARVARQAEAMGFDIQLFGENHAMAPDIFAEMRSAAEATSRIRLLCGPVNFVTRDPGVIASAIAAVQIASDGRALCGIARGDSAVALAGRRPQAQADLARDLGLLSTYLSGETVEFPERTSALQWIGDLPYRPVPIEMVCSGPRAIALAARCADRIGLSVGAHPERIRWAMGIIQSALDESGRSRESVRVGAYIPFAIAADRSAGAAALRSRVPGWAHMSSFRGIPLSQQPAIMRRVTEQLREHYDYRYHREGAPQDNPNTQIVDEAFADWFGLGGPPTYLADRLSELVSLGIDGFSSAFAPEEIETFAAKVIPAVRRAAE